MGLIGRVLDLVFGRGGLGDLAEVFRENAEGAGLRAHEGRMAALSQLGAELRGGRGAFDRIMDGVNRLPRPAMALGTLGLFVSAMWAPEWFAARMAGIALVPEPLWWLMGAIVSFYFGARHQTKAQEFRASVAETLAAGRAIAAHRPRPNAALREWRDG
ncbi:MAG: holin family protein [Hasllibacter sp.]